MESSANQDSIVKEEDYVLLRKGSSLRLHQVISGRDIWIEKLRCTLDGIVGHYYGTTFEVKDRALVKVTKPEAEQVEVDTSDGIETEKDNRNLKDSDANQKLTMEEIEQMKKEGVSGDKMIEKLIENSTTFQTKTGYAQEKWVKKKKKKHSMEFTVLRPTSRLLCELQWSKGPGRICNLRVESLAQILTMGNVRAHAKVAVVDTCQGLVAGAVLERLGGFGTLINIYNGDIYTHMNYAMERYGFSKEVMAPLHHFPLDELNTLSSTSVGNGDTSDAAADDGSSNMMEETESTSKQQTETDKCETNKQVESLVKVEMDVEMLVDEDTGNGNGDKDQEEDEGTSEGKRSRKGGKGKQKKRPNWMERSEARRVRRKETLETRKLLLEKNLDCLIVASRFHPTPIVLFLLQYLLPSRQVVVYSQHKEALQDCFAHLQKARGVLNYRVTETWLRDYQVLPNRTHPVIQMSGTGGYLLTATTVA